MTASTDPWAVPAAPSSSLEDGALRHVEPGYRNLIRLRLAMTWLLPVVGALVLDQALDSNPVRGLASTLVPLLAILSVVLVPDRLYRRLRYRLTDTLLQVVRGWLVHVDTIVPLVRVQHIDVTRGPLDKLFGTATLVVHTAGTHNSVVTLPGLSPDNAASIRDTIRAHVRTDFE